MVSKKDFLKKLNLSSIYIAYKGRLTEVFIPKIEYEKIFSPYGEKYNVSFLVGETDHEVIFINDSRKNSAHKRGFLTKDKENIVEISKSLKDLVENINASDEIKKELLDIHLEPTNENIEKALTRGYRIFPEQFHISCPTLNVLEDWTSLSNEKRFYHSKSLINPVLEEHKTDLVPFSVNHNFDKKKDFIVSFKFYFEGHYKKFSSLVPRRKNGYTEFVMNDPQYMSPIASTSREQLIKEVTEFFKEKQKVWQSLSETKGLKVVF